MTEATYHGVDNLRLEVETAPAGLPNLVRNPSGAKGAWGYVTPIANTVLTSDGALLTFKTTPSQASNWTTEFLPLAAGKYVGARFSLEAITAGHNVKCTFDFYDSNKALLSSSAQTSGMVHGLFYIPGVVAPASTAYVKLRWNLYTGTSNPSAGASATFDLVMVTWANTLAAVGASVRTNLAINPTFESNTTGWTRETGTMGRSTAQAYLGTASLALTPVSGDAGRAVPAKIAVTPGKDYTASAYVRTDAGTEAFDLLWRVYDTHGNVYEYASTQIIASTTWARIKFTLTAQSDWTYMQPVFSAQDQGHVCYLDAVLIEQASAAGGYFDGSSSGAGYTYAWTGTAHASTSTESTTLYPFTEPLTWRNILGPTHEITIDRHALDVGSMHATVLDALLDPAVSTDLAPGKTIRLRALSGTGTPDWDNVFEGRIDDADVNYAYDENQKLRTTITLNASDNIAALANVPQSQGLATIAALPYILEGAGVPWDVNGSGNQVGAASSVNSNPNASLLDQIAITRDSVSGYAWVDRFNVLNAYDAASMPSVASCTFSDVTSAAANRDEYSAIDAGYNTTDVINQVLVVWLRYNPATGDTTEITYGPYVDAVSVSTYGARQATFTMQGATESSANIAAFAAGVLAANKTPQRRATGLTMPVRDQRSLTHATVLDLYDLAGVVFSTIVNANYRVTSIKHSITTEKWLVTYGFTVDGTVASPTPQPSSDGSGVATDGTWITPALANSWVYYGSPFATVQYMRRDGIVYLKGLIKNGTLNSTVFTLPPGYRPSEQRLFTAITNSVITSAASAGTAHTHTVPLTATRISVTAAGAVGQDSAAASNAYVSLDGISFPAEV